MKRTVTEIFIEVEETVAVRMTEKSSDEKTELNLLTNEHSACPFCGQTMNKIIEIEKGESDK